MAVRNTNKDGLLLALGLGLVATNIFLYMRLSARLDATEHLLSTLQAQRQDTEGVAEGWESIPRPAASTSAGRYSLSPELLRQFRQLKNRPAVMDPVTLTARMEGLLRNQPANPVAEQQHALWLNTALERMPGDAPEAQDVHVGCQGQRCLVSGIFRDDDDARSWAMQYVLTAGGRQLQGSKTVVIPLEGSDNAVSLQLHFY